MASLVFSLPSYDFSLYSVCSMPGQNKNSISSFFSAIHYTHSIKKYFRSRINWMERRESENVCTDVKCVSRIHSVEENRLNFCLSLKLKLLFGYSIERKSFSVKIKETKLFLFWTCGFCSYHTYICRNKKLYMDYGGKNLNFYE